MTEPIQIVSLNVGMPKQVRHNERDISTGIYKSGTSESLYLSRLNLEGDGQGDLIHHGGREKAVCVYPYEHYPFWEKELQTSLDYGAFGENLTVRGLLEFDVCIGDMYRLGQSVVQVSQPRQPCYKLSVRYGAPDMPLKVQHTGYTGFYFRVLEEGMVSQSGGLSLLQRHPHAVTVAYANHIMHRAKEDREGIARVLEVDALSTNWRNTLLKRLEGTDPDSRERLTGSS